MRVGIHIRTPLFSGGTDPKKMDRIHETGILGSLRWWYEAVVRGLAGADFSQDGVCNPTDQDATHRCNKEKNTWVCRVCSLFGATGWARRFHLELTGGKPLFPGEGINIRAPGGNHGWFFYPPFIDIGSPIIAQLTNIRDARVVNTLSVVMKLISAWGGLGAKTQHGFGVVDMNIEDEDRRAITPNVNDFLRQFGDAPAADGGLPSLSNMFFAKLYLHEGVRDDWWEKATLGTGANDKVGIEKWRLRKTWSEQDSFSVPVAPAVKYKLRFGWTPPGTKITDYPLRESSKDESFVFGQTGRSNRKAMINISNAYKENDSWQFRIWGWFPHDARNISRESLMTELNQLITSPNGAPFWESIFGAGVVDLNKSVWREIDAAGHDRNKPPMLPITTCKEFLRGLLS